MSNAVREFAISMGKIPADIRKELRPALRAAAKGVQKDAQANASWSSRIPRAIKIGVSMSGKRGGVTLRVDSSIAPHARPYEGMVGRVFRHPLFGNRERWFPQASRPFLQPAVLAGRADVVKAVDDAVDAIAARHGFR